MTDRHHLSLHRLVLLVLLVLAALAAATFAGEGEDTTAGAEDLVARLERYFETRAEDPEGAARELFAQESRIWFETKEGPGRLRGPAGRGPWADWDEAMNASSTRQETTVSGRAVHVTSVEINDFYRLIERAPRKVRVTYTFNAQGKVEGTLIAAGERASDRFDEAKAWLGEHYPEALAELMPEGEVVPSVENARRWRKLLGAWRKAVGLPPVE